MELITEGQQVEVGLGSLVVQRVKHLQWTNTFSVRVLVQVAATLLLIWRPVHVSWEATADWSTAWTPSHLCGRPK